MKSISVLSVCALAWQAAAEVKHGTIGFGINMYHPWCGTACSDTLSSLWLNCTTFDEEVHDHHGMKKRMEGMDGPMGTTSPECYASNQPWLETFSYCIKSHCDAEGTSADQQEQFWQQKAAGGLEVPRLDDALPRNAPTDEVAEGQEWLSQTMLANEEAWKTDRATIMVFENLEHDHAMFSIVVLVVSVAAPVLAGAWLFFTASRRSSLFNSVRSRFTQPALSGGRHSEPLPWKMGYVPSRSTSTIVAIYIILNVIFSAVDFHSVMPSAWYSNRNQEMSAFVGNRAGVLSFANMALAILFSARNIPLAYFSGWHPTTFITLHRWAARVAIVQAVVHSIAYTADYALYMQPSMYEDEAKLAYFWWGILATVAMALMAGVSILPIRARAYELFLVLHIGLAILSLVGCWYHIILRFSYNWGYEVWLYLAFAFWSYDRLVRFGRVVFYSFLGGTSHGQLESIPGVDNIVSLKLYPSRHFNAAPGQHTFVYFPLLGRFWENHPFTIAGWGVDRAYENHSSSERSSTDGKATESAIRVTTKPLSQGPLYVDQFYVRCLFRAHSGSTAKLCRSLAQNPTPTVLCEGAYGGHSPVTKAVLKHAERILIVAGGIGITFAAAFAKQFAEEGESQRGTTSMPHCQQLVLAWSMREHGLLEYARRELLPPPGRMGERSLEYRLHVTGTPQDKEAANSASTGRMDIEATLGSVMDKSKKIVVLVCGPGGLADDVRREVVSCSKSGFDVELIEESFAW